MKAVIGQQDHQTNFFDASIKTVRIQPRLGRAAIESIRNEMLPHLKRDPRLSRQGRLCGLGQGQDHAIGQGRLVAAT
ncbi:hypothetical protein LVY75_24115 [Sinorhizobium sp. B11]